MKIEEKIMEILEAYRRAVVHMTMAQGTNQDVQVSRNTIPKILQLLEEEKREIFRGLESKWGWTTGKWRDDDSLMTIRYRDYQALKSRYLS